MIFLRTLISAMGNNSTTGGLARIAMLALPLYFLNSQHETEKINEILQKQVLTLAGIEAIVQDDHGRLNTLENLLIANNIQQKGRDNDKRNR